MKYSEKKFRGFSKSKQKKVLLDLFNRIEKSWLDRKNREALICNLVDCLNWYDLPEASELGSKIRTCFRLEDFLTLIVPWERQFGRDMTDSDFIIYDQDETTEITKPFPLYPVLIDLRSSFNVGAIFRTAECLNLEKIYLTGYTATPVNRKVTKTAMGTDKKMKWEFFQNINELFNIIEERSLYVYALETTSRSESFYEIEYTFPCALLLGNEALGIPHDILEMADQVISIPTRGWKNSLNVATSMAVCAYEMYRHWNLV